MQPWLFGPYQILCKVGEVAYEFELLEERRIHKAFHISLLNKFIGKHETYSTIMPPLDDEG